MLINTVLLPGRIHTRIWDQASQEVIAERTQAILLGCFGDADEVANLLLLLASELDPCGRSCRRHPCGRSVRS